MESKNIRGFFPPEVTAPLHQVMPLTCSRSEELRQCQAATLEQMERYEAKHLGGFRRIYPREGGEKYDKYFKHSSSLFQETAASKAREECARYPQRV